MKKGQLRRAQARRMLEAELEGKHTDWSPRRVKHAAELALRQQDENPYYADELLNVAPQSYLPHRSKVSTEVEARAWMEHPATQWLVGVTCGRGPGRPAERRTCFSALMHMVSGTRPEMKQSLSAIAQSALQMWAYYAPRPRAPTSAAYATLKFMAYRHAAGMCIHANVTMVLEMAALAKANGKPRFRHPLRDLAVDGMLMKANVPQHPPEGRSVRERKKEERRIAGPDRPMAQYVVYARGKIVGTAADGVDANRRTGIIEECFGYKLVALLSIALQVPIIWTLIPATGDERVALRALVRALYRLVPDFPARHLVGDGLYGMDASLIEWLDRCYGITGVFPLHPGIRKDLSYSATNGVPKCKHGWATHVGVRHEWASTRRQLAGMAPGVRAPGAPGHRWKCKLGHKCPEIRETTAREDYRMFPPLPHAGLNRLHARRVALSRYRNVLESCWGSTQHRGVGADWPSRIRIGGDDTARWAISLALLRATSARLAHANGEYERLLQRAVDVGLIEKCGEYPVPVDALKARTPEQQDLLEHDVNASPDAIPPDTWGNPVTLPIDEPYRLPDLTEFSDIPDRVAA